MKIPNQHSFSLENIEKEHVFLVPENYFESLDKNIENRIIELKTSSIKQVFKLPEGYFEQATISINRKIKSESVLDNPELKKSVFKMPKGYLASEEDRISTTILSAKEAKTTPFAIPENYFETLIDKVQDKIGEKDNVIKLDFAFSPVVRYSIAASIAFILIASALFFVVGNRKQNFVSETKANDQLAKVVLASLDKNEVKKYLEKQEIEVETHEWIEFSSDKKKEKIKSDLEQEIISASISETEKQAIEFEMNDLDVSELATDI